MLKGIVREAAAEFLGTFVLIVFGVGVVAQTVLFHEQKGDFLSINIAWGLAVMLAIYVCGGVSGAHINPAVTVALAVHRGFPWRKVLPYCAAQLAGAFVASYVVYATYHEALDAYDGGQRQVVGEEATASIWATYPAKFDNGKYLSTFPGGFVDQVVGTALLVGVIFGIADRRNQPPEPGFAPVAVGAVVLTIGMAFGANAGYAINPARDLGPRLFTAMSGWGTDVFTVFDYWWWVPIAGPLVGGILGGFAYDLFITRIHPPIHDSDSDDE